MFQATITTMQISNDPMGGQQFPAMPTLDSNVAQRCMGLNNTGFSPGAQLPGLGGTGGLDPRMMMMQQMQMMEVMLDMMALMLGAGGGMGQAMGMPQSLQQAASSGGGAAGSGATGGAVGANQTMASNAPVTANVEKLVQALSSSYHKAAKENFPIILAECQKQGVTDKAQIAYILATTVHESGAGAHMEEFASGSAYEGRKDLGNNQSGDGVRYKGRGYVQITGRNNYTNWSKKLGIDLVGNPELAEKPENAARILVEGMKEGSFTGKKLGDYIGGGKQDFEGARRIVNGTDKASVFADTARKLMAAL
ncbi:hypothetical protein IV102_06490 [bacterium]|nr:hypothetical protein [bacterium]